jgi:hypothetical protein
LQLTNEEAQVTHCSHFDMTTSIKEESLGTLGEDWATPSLSLQQVEFRDYLPFDIVFVQPVVIGGHGLGMTTGQVWCGWSKNPPLTTSALNETLGCNVTPVPTHTPDPIRGEK